MERQDIEIQKNARNLQSIKDGTSRKTRHFELLPGNTLSTLFTFLINYLLSIRDMI